MSFCKSRTFSLRKVYQNELKNDRFESFSKHCEDVFSFFERNITYLILSYKSDVDEKRLWDEVERQLSKIEFLGYLGYLRS